MAENGSTRKMKAMTLIDLIHSQMQENLNRTGGVSLALSGGSSPVSLYQGLSERDLDWSNVTLTLIDDRQVSADHPDSNQLLIARTMRQNNASAAHFIPLADWPEDHIPDIAILGMGTDGHFASLFPSMLDQAEAFNPAAKPAILKTGPEGSPKHNRITMNLAMILAIPFRTLLVIGAEKQAVLSAARSGTDLPITRLLQHDGTQIITEGE